MLKSVPGRLNAEISVKRVHAPRGKLNVQDKQETVISSRGMSNVKVTIPQT